LLRVGDKSADDSVIIGRDGFIFLYRGSNDVASLYGARETDKAIQETASRWGALFSKRIDLLERSAISFYQLLLPEKSTILSDLAPQDLGPVTPALSAIDRLFLEVSANSDKHTYRSLIDGLRSAYKNGVRIFPKTSTHLTAGGSVYVLDVFLRSLAHDDTQLLPTITQICEELNKIPYVESPRIYSGDIGNRFGIPMFEYLADLDISLFSANKEYILEDVQKRPPSSAHIGTHIIWRNKLAPLNLKVVCFGNSFFERGVYPTGLSWWFKHLFSEFHFIWSPWLDYDYVQSVRPDIVVCQTIERFLMLVPRS
jgi:hypothetical protein